jgi:hypothetical protein
MNKQVRVITGWLSNPVWEQYALPPAKALNAST